MAGSGVRPQLGLECGERERIAEVLAFRIGPFGTEQRVRLAHPRGPGVLGAEGGDRIAHNLLHGDLWVHDLMYEGAVGAVLEQARQHRRGSSSPCVPTGHTRAPAAGWNLGARRLVQRPPMPADAEL